MKSKQQHLLSIEAVLDETSWVESDPVLKSSPDREHLKTMRHYLIADIRELSPVHADREWKTSLGDYALRYPTQYLIDLDFIHAKAYLDPAAVEKHVREYVLKVGGWANATIEFDPMIHCHLALGGIDLLKFTPHILEKFWTHGDAKVVRYNPHQPEGVRYRTKHPEEFFSVGRLPRRARRHH